MSVVEFIIVMSVFLLYFSYIVFKSYETNKYDYSPTCPKRCNPISAIVNIKTSVVSVLLILITIRQSYFNCVLGIFLFMFCLPFSYVISYFFLAGRLIKSPFPSISDFICYYYGNGARVIYAISELISNISIVVIANVCIAKNLLEIIGVPYPFVLVTLFILIITMMINSLNDDKEHEPLIVSLLKLTIFLTIPFICIFLIFKEHDVFMSIDSLNPLIHEKMSIFSLPRSTGDLFIYIAMTARFIFPFIEYETYSYTITANRKKELNSFIYSTLAVIIYSFFAITTGLTMFCLNQDLEEKEMLEFLVHIIKYPAIQGLFIIAVFYFVVKESKILKIFSNVLANDIFCSLSPKFNAKKNLNGICVVLLGIIICILSIFDVDPIALFYYCSCSNLPVLVVPTTLTILGLRTHKNCIYLSIIAGLSTSFLFVLLTLNTKYCKFAFFPGMISNTIFLLISHLYYVYCKKFKFNKDDVLKSVNEKMNTDNTRAESLLNISRRTLLLKMKSMFGEKNNQNLSDEKIFKSYIDNDYIKTQLEYKIYKFYVYRFILKKPIDNYNDKEFIEAVNEDAKNLIKKP